MENIVDKILIILFALEINIYNLISTQQWNYPILYLLKYKVMLIVKKNV